MQNDITSQLLKKKLKIISMQGRSVPRRESLSGNYFPLWIPCVEIISLQGFPARILYVKNVKAEIP